MTYRVNVRSRHNTHAVLRTDLPKMPVRAIVRLGSTTTKQAAYSGRNLTTTQLNGVVEVNTVKAVENSSSKIKMKECFNQHNVPTANWFRLISTNKTGVKDMQNGGTTVAIADLPYPIIAKKTNGSRGEGMLKLDNVNQMKNFLNTHANSPNGYILEEFMSYAREFRLHITADGCFYTCRKALKTNTPEDERWYMNDNNCTWLIDTNPNFNKPSNWDAIVTACKKAAAATGLDICAIDVKVQKETKANGTKRQGGPKFIILETNSAPSFAAGTTQKYLAEIPKVIRRKSGVVGA